MPRKAELVPLATITAIFDALDILGKIDRRELSARIVVRRPATNPAWAGGFSYIINHYRQGDGTHIATTHEVRWRNTRPHRHGKLVLLGEIKFATEEEQR